VWEREDRGGDRGSKIYRVLGGRAQTSLYAKGGGEKVRGTKRGGKPILGERKGVRYRTDAMMLRITEPCSEVR